MPIYYMYGMRLRGYSPGSQPKGVTKRRDDTTGRYHDIILYPFRLSDKQVHDYDLDYLGEELNERFFEAVLA